MQKTAIEWCDSTWNPVTGCLHGCEYCYARKQAWRFIGYTGMNGLTTGRPMPLPELIFPLRKTAKSGKSTIAPYPYGFHPTFHRYKLDEYARKKKPRTIFVCSMADLFGDWVPTKWIVDVFDACLKGPQHRYLFLTKNPKRYLELEKMALLPHEDNFWYGSTITSADDEAAWFENMGLHWFVSIEPLLSEIDLTKGDCRLPEWVIVGAETGNRTSKVVPEWEWVRKIAMDCATFEIPLFMKNSLVPIWGESLITEFPWEENN